MTAEKQTDAQHKNKCKYKLLQITAISCVDPTEVKSGCTLPGFTGIFLHDKQLTSERLRNFSVTEGSEPMNWDLMYKRCVTYAQKKALKRTCAIFHAHSGIYQK